MLGTRHKAHQTQILNIHIESKLKQVDKQNLLGVFIDENLSWTSRIDYLCATISSKVSLLKQLSSYVPVEIQKLFYQGYILPWAQIPGEQLQNIILNGYPNYKNALLA